MNLERNAKIIELHKAGLTARQVGLQVKASKNAVIGVLHRNNIRQAKPETPKEQQQARTRNVTLPKAFDPTVFSEVEERDLPEQVIEEYEGITILDLKPGQCRYPVHSIERSHFFCGEPVEGDKSYCPVHARACLMTVQEYHAALRRYRRQKAKK